MEKSVKLQRYDRKDYTELVDFPVEIVGRDGVVRRYTFEDSIRLYQRRITFAPIRYRDTDLVRAEVNHCRSRIDQLRRSYFHRYGWGTPDGQASAEESFGDLAGELAAFICRVLGVDGRPEIEFQQVTEEIDGISTWYLTPENVRSGMLLYFHRFDGSSADAVRDRFFTSLKELERIGRSTGDAERLLAFHHTVDCGFVLTGRGADYASFVQPKDDNPQPVDLAPTPWDEVLEIIRKGDYEAALHRCRDLVVREQPWHRNAYVAGAMLAGYLGEHGQGEDLALIGSKYFPRDGVLLYYLGLCRLRLGRVEEAMTDLTEAVKAAPDLVSARALLVTQLVRAHRFDEASRVLRDREGVVPDDRRAEADLHALEQAITVRRGSLWACGLLVLAGAGLLVVAPSTVVGPIVGAVGFLFGLGGWYLFNRQVDSVEERQKFEEIPQGMRRLHRGARTSPVIS